nr:MAG TPA: hypothetical protein [Caudoviricetes sp.]
MGRRGTWLHAYIPRASTHRSCGLPRSTCAAAARTAP